MYHRFVSLILCIALATCGNAALLGAATSLLGSTETVVSEVVETTVSAVSATVSNLTASDTVKATLDSLKDAINVTATTVAIVDTVAEELLDNANGTLVEVEQGKLFGAYLLGSMDAKFYYSYKGIPYAKPPVGTLRFKDPQPAESWNGVRLALTHGSICPQVNMLLNVFLPGSEDCLFLNVYSPNIKADPLLPVIVFIHGGVYKFGSGNVDNYGPDFLMTQDVVVVTFNYRLDALGFLSMGTKDVPGNAGLKDQVLALKWVQKNIHKFGGNPENVTLMAQSAGSAALSLHLISPMSKGLFKRAICLSGIATSDFNTARYPLRRFRALARSLGFDSKNATEVLEFLQSVPYYKLINTTSTVIAAEETTEYFVKIIPFPPVIESDVGQEDTFLLQDPIKALNSGNVNNVDLMTGYVEKEASTFVTYTTTFLPSYYEYPEMFVPASIVYTSTNDEVFEQSTKIIDRYMGNKSASLATMPELVDFISNATFVHDAHRFARKFSKYHDVYFYKFNILSTRNFYGNLLGGLLFNITGPAHLDDLLYYFDAKLFPLLTLTANTIEYNLVKMCTSLVANFAKYGNPTPDSSLGFTWDKYNETSLSYLDYSNSPSMKTGADESDVQFWKGVLESAGIKCNPATCGICLNHTYTTAYQLTANHRLASTQQNWCHLIMAKVRVQQGWLAGERLELVTGDGLYYSFKGIPYAEPPVGKLRFKAPQPPLPWDGVRDAKEHGHRCPHKDIFTQELILESEDCLHLNVYTPDLKPDTPLPVMFFIHGGGFKSGSGNVDHYGPDFLVCNNIVLVTINYRLDALGFLCLDTEDVPGNAGLKDQVAALKWVRDNIANFGGDPNNVTVFGESAGGASTSLHIISPMSKGLFKRAIPMSGVPFCDWSVPFLPQKRAFALGKLLGFETKDPNKLLEFLQSVPFEQLVNTNPTVFSYEEINNNVLKFYHFTPVVEKDFGKERFLSTEPLGALKSGKINDVDVLIGYTSEETVIVIKHFENNFIPSYNKYWDLVVPRKIIQKCSPEILFNISNRIHDFYFDGKSINKEDMKKFVRYCNDACFVYDILRFASHLPQTGAGRRYFYKFSCFSQRNVYGQQGLKYGVQGAAHLDDLMYLFDPKENKLNIDKSSKEYELIQLVCKVFTNFARYGNPTPDGSLGVIWPEYDNVNKAYVELSDTLVPGASPEDASFQFWKSIFKYAGVEF